MDHLFQVSTTLVESLHSELAQDRTLAHSHLEPSESLDTGMTVWVTYGKGFPSKPNMVWLYSLLNKRVVLPLYLAGARCSGGGVVLSVTQKHIDVTITDPKDAYKSQRFVIDNKKNLQCAIDLYTSWVRELMKRELGQP